MNNYNKRIQAIAQRKALSRHVNGIAPNLTYSSLEPDEQAAIVLDLLAANETIREPIFTRISNDILCAYCDMVEQSEAIEGAIELERLRRDDIAQRSRDMNLAMQGK